jgi:hypothetical protein
MATDAALTSHQNQTTVHTAALNLANRDLSGPDAGLLTFLQLAKGSEVDTPNDATVFLARDRIFRKQPRLSTTSPQPLHIEPDDDEVTLLELPIPDTWKNDTLQATIEAFGFIEVQPATGSAIRLRLYIVNTLALQTDVPCNTSGIQYFWTRTAFDGCPALTGSSMIQTSLTKVTSPVPEMNMEHGDPTSYNVPSATLRLTAQLVNCAPTTYLSIDSARATNAGMPS